MSSSQRAESLEAGVHRLATRLGVAELAELAQTLRDAVQNCGQTLSQSKPLPKAELAGNSSDA